MTVYEFCARLLSSLGLQLRANTDGQLLLGGPDS